MVGHEAVRLSLISSLWQRGIIVAAVVACTWSESRAEVIGPRPMAVSHSGHHGAAGGLRAKVAQRPSHPNAYQDGLVVHAGGAYAGQIDSLIGHGGHGRAECRHDGCGDHCVVSPQRFGFYGTRWRTWPGTRVVQTAGAEELTPVSPPAMELPGAGQESRDPDAPFDFGFEEPLDDPRSVTLPGLWPGVCSTRMVRLPSGRVAPSSTSMSNWRPSVAKPVPALNSLPKVSCTTVMRSPIAS